jgi:hypothetical protein
VRNCQRDHRRSHALGNDLRTSCIGIGQEKREFLAAKARGKIAGTLNRRADSACDETKAIVAGGMSVFLVELLEVIDVDRCEREARAALPHGAPPFHRQHVVESTAVRAAREAFSARQFTKLGFKFLACGDVARDLHDVVRPRRCVARDAQRGFQPDLAAVLFGSLVSQHDFLRVAGAAR